MLTTLDTIELESQPTRIVWIAHTDGRFELVPPEPQKIVIR